MSNLVLLEGFLRQRLKQKEMLEIYAVLTPSTLKTYRSQIAYQQTPNHPTKTVDFISQYNIIEMPFEKTPMFSLFKRGEKADERLYLEASTRSDYDLWFGQIDNIISKVSESVKVNISKPIVSDLDIKSPLVSNSNNIGTLDKVDGVSVPKVLSPKYNIKTPSPSIDIKQLQQTCDNTEAQLQKEKKLVTDVKLENVKLKKQLSDAEKRVVSLEKERSDSIAKINDLKKEISALNSSIVETYEFSEKQLEKAGKDMSLCFSSSTVDFTSYQKLIDYLCTQDNHLRFLNLFLKRQLEDLIHRTPIDPSSGVSLFKYLSTSIDMSNGCIAKFLSTFLLTLSIQISCKPSSKSDLSPNVTSLIQSIVQQVPPLSSSDTKKSFHQTSLEIAYLLSQMSSEQNLLLNGYTNSTSVDEKFKDLLESLDIELVNKVFIVELGQHIKERSLATISTSKQPDKITLDKNIINQQFEGLWENLRVQLQQKEQENSDLLIAIREITARNLELEACNSKSEDWRNVDTIVNYYSCLSSKLCSSCQSNVAEVLQMPVTKMVDKLVEGFISYWTCINDLTTFLAKKKNTNSDVRESLEMMKKSSQEWERLMSQLQEITQRTISDPGKCE